MVHELSIAYQLVETAVAVARANNVRQVDAVHLRLGALSGVAAEALLFGYDVATTGTVLAGSRLEIETLPVIVFCPYCQSEQRLEHIQYFCCPHCQQMVTEVVQGKEIELTSLEYCDEATVT